MVTGGIMKLNGSQILIETLIEEGTRVIFGYPGGAVLNIYDALYQNSDRIRHIISAHEQGAAHAADGYARVSGEVGVVIATSGPGATNLVTGIANAYLDSVPMVAITGNVACSLLGRDSFQEVDTVGITMPITKHNFMVKDVAKLADTIREAFRIAKSGRPGPVLVDIPRDVQINITEYTPMPKVIPKPLPLADDREIETAAEMIRSSQRPYIYCGGGVVLSNCGELVEKLADLIDAPIGFSMMGLSAISGSNPRSLGMTGMHGSYAASYAKNESDLVIALGARFSDRATGDKSKYAGGAKVIHIDVDKAEINKNIAAYLGIEADVGDTLKKLISLLEPQKRPEWQSKIYELRRYGEEKGAECIGKLSPYDIIDHVSESCSDDTPIITDVGQHQMWVAQRYRFRKPRTFITSGGLGAMGFGMGAAIGSCIASGKRSVLFTGDGSFGMNLNELATAVSQNLPLTVIIMNNGVLGMVRQWQNMFYSEHYSQTTLNRKTDFVKLAEAFGAFGMRAENIDEFKLCLKKSFNCEGPSIIECIIDKDEKVLPMIPPNSSVDKIICK
jgi:acetolactate synthase-1/2/3 large subunit